MEGKAKISCIYAFPSFPDDDTQKKIQLAIWTAVGFPILNEENALYFLKR